MSLPAVTVVVPCLNGAKTIERCLSSIFNQSLSPQKVLFVIDKDNSDNSAQLAKNFAIELIESQAHGAAAVRNEGWRKASTPYIAFVDVDCDLDIHWLKNLLDFAHKHNLAATQGKIIPHKKSFSALDLYRDFKKKSFTQGSYIDFFNIKKVPIINTSACIYQRKTLAAFDGFEESLKRLEDLDLSLKVSQVARIDASPMAICYVSYARGWFDFLKRQYDDGKNAVILNYLWANKFELYDSQQGPLFSFPYNIIRKLEKILFNSGLRKKQIIHSTDFGKSIRKIKIARKVLRIT